MTSYSQICVTGSEGLIGTSLVAVLRARGDRVKRLDPALPSRHSGHGTILDEEFLRTSLQGCDGVVDLAAVSRVVWGERDPERCWAVNVEGTRLLLKTAIAMPRPPWILLASSREVYGRPDRLPTQEDDPRAPINAYGRSKTAAELLCEEAGKCGLAVAIARFSNVYGSIRDARRRRTSARHQLFRD